MKNADGQYARRQIEMTPCNRLLLAGLALVCLFSNNVCCFGECLTGACVEGSLPPVRSGPTCGDATDKDNWKCITCKDYGRDYFSPGRSAAERWELSKTAESLAEFQKWYDDNYDQFDDYVREGKITMTPQ